MINETLGILAGEILSVLDEGKRKPDRRRELARTLEETEEIVDASLSFLSRQGTVDIKGRDRDNDIFYKRNN